MPLGGSWEFLVQIIYPISDVSNCTPAGHPRRKGALNAQKNKQCAQVPEKNSGRWGQRHVCNGMEGRTGLNPGPAFHPRFSPQHFFKSLGFGEKSEKLKKKRKHKNHWLPYGLDGCTCRGATRLKWPQHTWRFQPFFLIRLAGSTGNNACRKMEQGQEEHYQLRATFLWVECNPASTAWERQGDRGGGREALHHAWPKW